MNDRYSFESHSDDFTPEPAIVNRILRFESGAAFTDTDPEPQASAFPCSQLDGLDIAHHVAVPEGYEPTYAYPLIVWLHDDGAEETEICDVLPRISDRNYLGVSLRGNVIRESGFGWTTANGGLSLIVGQLNELLSAVQRQFSIHTHRIYLAGFGTGGTVAWEILLRQPRDWSGAICLSADFPQIDHPLAMFRQLQQRRLLLSTGLDGTGDLVKQMVDAGRLMYSAGMEVGTRVYDAGRRTPSDKMLRDVDRWVMDCIATAIR